MALPEAVRCLSQPKLQAFAVHVLDHRRQSVGEGALVYLEVAVRVAVFGQPAVIKIPVGAAAVRPESVSARDMLLRGSSIVQYGAADSHILVALVLQTAADNGIRGLDDYLGSNGACHVVAAASEGQPRVPAPGFIIHNAEYAAG